MATLAVLSGGTGWHVQDVLRVCHALGHAARLVDFRTLAAGVNAGPDPFAGCDAALVRTVPAGSLEQVVFRMDALHAAEARGVRVVNPPRAVEACVSKYLTTARLAAAGLPTPPTVVCQTPDAAMAAFRDLGGDVVVKPVFGAEGRGMVRVSDPELAWRTVRAVAAVGGVVYLQQFVPHPGWDARAFVLAGRVLAGMRRTNPTDWRTNVAQGGTATPLDLDADACSLALRACRALGASVAGVDLLPRPGGGWLVIEVNAVPGWRALAATCGVDVAAAVVRHALGED